MTDKGYYEPGRANGYNAQDTVAPNGHDPAAPAIHFDSTPASSAGIVDQATGETAWDGQEPEEDAHDAGAGNGAAADVADDDAHAVAIDADTEERAAAESDELEMDETAANDPDTDETDPGVIDTDEVDADAANPAGEVSGPDPEEEAVEAEAADEEAEPAAPEFTDEDRWRHLRMGEALLFASAEPLRKEQLAERLPDGADVDQVLADLAEYYADRGVNLMRVAGGWAFRTATDLSFLMERERVEQRKLSRAALETLAIIAYHQPVTRAEIEDVRGVSVSKGTLDVLMEIGWVRVRGRRQTPGRPVTYGTSDMFLEHFGLDRIGDLPGLDELKAAGLLDTRMPTNIHIPRPSDADESETGDEEEESLYAHDDEVDDDRLAVEPDQPEADEDLTDEAEALTEDAASDEADVETDADDDFDDPGTEEYEAESAPDDASVETEAEAGPDPDDDPAGIDDAAEIGVIGSGPDEVEMNPEAANGTNGAEPAGSDAGEEDEDWPSPERGVAGGASESRDSRS